jgi:hypothetical protein
MSYIDKKRKGFDKHMFCALAEEIIKAHYIVPSRLGLGGISCGVDVGGRKL